MLSTPLICRKGSLAAAGASLACLVIGFLGWAPIHLGQLIGQLCMCGCGLYDIRPWAEWRGKTSPEGNGGDESSGQEPWAQASVHVTRQGQQSPEGQRCSRGLDKGGRSRAAGPGDVVSIN